MKQIAFAFKYILNLGKAILNFIWVLLYILFLTAPIWICALMFALLIARASGRI